jgi:acetyltransferase-like isoleucine patch superfamily enzyme
MDCMLGLWVYIDVDVAIGNRVHLHNRVSVFRGARIEDDVFIGPHSCLLNDRNPRVLTGDGAVKRLGDWKVEGVTVQLGASIGGGCTILPGINIGRYALVGGGSVVTRDVANQALVFGNPARHVGYVCECGEPLDASGTCAKDGRTYADLRKDQAPTEGRAT